MMSTDPSDPVGEACAGFLSRLTLARVTANGFRKFRSKRCWRHVGRARAMISHHMPHCWPSLHLKTARTLSSREGRLFVRIKNVPLAARPWSADETGFGQAYATDYKFVCIYSCQWCCQCFNALYDHKAGPDN